MLSISSVLALDPLQRTKAEVLAGGSSLQNPVSWVHISEMEHLAHIFHGGELLLTQGRGVPRGETEQRNWILELANAGLAGIAIEDSHVFDEIPPALIEAAEDADLPLIRMTRPAYFMEITRAVHSSIVSSEHDGLLHADHLGQRATQLLMGGGSLKELMDEISSALSHPVVLTGPTHLLQAFSPRTDTIFSNARNWRKHVKHDHELSSGTGPSTCATDIGHCLYQPIHYQGEFWGCLHVLLGEHKPTPLTVRVVQQAVMIISLAFAAHQGHSYIGNDVRSEILQELLGSSRTSLGDLQERFQWAGLDIARTARVLLAEPLDSGSSIGPGSYEQKRAEALLALTREIEHRLDGRVLAGIYNNQVAAICSADCTLEGLQDLCTDSGVRAVIGASDQVSLNSLARATRDAGDALKYALEIGHTQGLYRAEHLHLERILLKLDENGTLQEIVENELGPLLDYDEKSRSPLLGTLETLFERSGRKSEVARQLHLDRRTVHHRIARIERLLGRDFQHPDKQLSLHLAVRGLRFLRGRGNA